MGVKCNTEVMNTFAINSNHIILPGRTTAGYVVIEQGLIADIVLHLPSSINQVVDVGNKILMPGIVDPHVHINEPGRADWEGFHTATKAAIAGGITTLVDMPLNASPVTTTVDAFEEKLICTQNKLHTNCGFWGGIVPGNENEIMGLIEHGVLGFKAFLTHSGIEEFPNVTEADLVKVMPIIAKFNLPLLVHCELSDDKPYSTAANPCSYQDYLESRPKQWEDDAIALMIRLCEKFHCRVHIVHLSSANSIQQIKEAKHRGLPLTVETGQHYLYFSAEQISDSQTIFKYAPPIREKHNKELLWRALRDGVIDFVATDHSPAPPEFKALESGDFIKAWGGISSLQWALPALWTEARKRGFPATDLVQWLCEKPAAILGDKFKKGRIEVGYDADLVVMDPDQKFKVASKNIHHNHKITPYLHHELFGVVEQTWLGGKKVFDKGQMKLKEGKLLIGTN
jgi:allantoinase